MNRADRRALEESQGLLGRGALGRTRSTRNRVGNNPDPGVETTEGAVGTTRSTHNRAGTNPRLRDETPEGEIPIAIEVSDEDVSMRSHTTTEAEAVPDAQATAESPFEPEPEPEPLGHAETARHTNPIPDTSSLGTEDELDVFATDDGPSTHGTQPTNILTVRGRHFYENFRCPQTGGYETARIEGSPPWKSYVLLTLPPFSRGQTRRGYACKKEQLGLRLSKFESLRMLTSQGLAQYIRANGIPGIFWICPYTNLDPLLDDDHVNNPQRNTYTWMKLDGPDPPFVSRGVWNSVVRDEGQDRIETHYQITGQDPPLEPLPSSARAILQADGARLRSQTPADLRPEESGSGAAPRRPSQLQASRRQPRSAQAARSQPLPSVERPRGQQSRTGDEIQGQTSVHLRSGVPVFAQDHAGVTSVERQGTGPRTQATGSHGPTRASRQAAANAPQPQPTTGISRQSTQRDQELENVNQHRV
ncbi:hypothetical protein PG985_014779 [Apiospora marii]|uniref:uncharacterized protein n=1 Tax=Apiospora marii TaxID=335849 RepID=UPI00312D0983